MPVLRRGDKTDKLQKFATFLEPQDEQQMSTARLKMLRAGYRSKNAVRTFHAAQFALGIGLLLLGVIYAMVKSATAEVSTADAGDDDHRAGRCGLLPAAVLGAAPPADPAGQHHLRASPTRST